MPTYGDALAADPDFFSSLYENAPFASAICDMDGYYISVNAAMCRLLGYSKDELLQRRFVDVSHPDDVLRNIELREPLLSGKMPAFEMEKRYIHKDGHIVWAIMAISVIDGSDGLPRYTFGQMISLDKEKQMEQQLALVRRQRDTLVREVHHRIKNNLQAVCGLLHRHMQARPELRQILAEGIAQVEAIATIHGLQSMAHKGHLRLYDMLREIVASTNKLFGDRHALAIANTLSQPLLINDEEAVALALILNELLMNAVKHCCTGENRDIAITLEQIDEHCAAITITNAAAPLPTHFDFDGSVGTGMGLRLVRSLLPQSGAQIHFSRSNGTFTARIVLQPPVVYTRKPDSDKFHPRRREQI